MRLPPARFRLHLLLGVLALSLTLTACDSNDPNPPEPQTLADLLANTPALSTASEALDAAGLTGTLSDPDASFTVFVPRDAAFETLTVDALTDDTALLADVLRYHVVEGTLGPGDLTDGRTLPTLQGDTLTVSTPSNSILVNGAIVLQGGQASNGVAFIVDRVLLENRSAVERLRYTQNTQTLADAIDTAGLTDALSDPDASFTLFAPTDDAFDGVDLDALSQSELAEILSYHVIPSAALAASDITDGQTETTLQGGDVELTTPPEGIFVNDAQVSGANFGVRNGIIHEIDAVLMPATGTESE